MADEDRMVGKGGTVIQSQSVFQQIDCLEADGFLIFTEIPASHLQILHNPLNYILSNSHYEEACPDLEIQSCRKMSSYEMKYFFVLSLTEGNYL